MAIGFALTPEQLRIQQAARELSKAFARRAFEHDRDRSAPIGNYALLREAGFFGLVVPRELGGQGHGYLGWAVAAEELARGCASTALAFNMHVKAVGNIMEHPDISSETKQWVADLVVGEGVLLCTAVSEPETSGHLMPSYAPGLEARRVPGGYMLYGRKAFASMWEEAGRALLYAHLEEDANPQSAIGFLIPTGTEGVAVEDVWHTMGMRATRSQNVLFDGAFVPEEAVLHRTGAFVDSFITRGAAWSFGGAAAVYLGLGYGMIDEVRETLTGRVARGYAQPMGYHPDIRRRVAEMACQLEAARLSLWHAGWLHETEGTTEQTFLAFARAKYLVGHAVAETARNAAVACGMHSLFQGRPLERMIRDAVTAPIMPPNEDACLGLVGFHELGLSPAEAPSPVKRAER
ncbi:MAG TPA: acyl-CoA dehydrogenase family protein [Symbiobacteriaceae bacterium]|nr:acyl-CoA dehydrogenase family protein [Symbiobacteriaceae bacterium]